MAHAFASATAEVTDAVRENAVAICDGLREVSWGLAQIGNKLDKLIYLQSNPRTVEARELLGQAMRHFRAENYDYADERLRTAFNLDNTEYSILYNLGITAIFRGKTDEAINYFKLCARVPDHTTATARARALFSLARAQIINNDVNDAVKSMREAHALESTARNKFYLAIYLLKAGRETDGVGYLRSAIEQDEDLFVTTAVHEDLSEYVNLVIPLLKELAAKAGENFFTASKIASNLRSGSVGEHARQFKGAFPDKAMSLADHHAAEGKMGSYRSRVRYAHIVTAVQSVEGLCEKEISIAASIKALESDNSSQSGRLSEAINRSTPKLNFIDHGLYIAISVSVAVAWWLGSFVFGVKLADSWFGAFFGTILAAAFWPITFLISLLYAFGKDTQMMWMTLVGIIPPIAYTLLHRDHIKISQSERDKDMLEGQAKVKELTEIINSNGAALREIRAQIEFRLKVTITGNQ